MSLYDKLGGTIAIDAVVDNFYARVLEDPRIRHFFQGVEVARLRSHQKAFLALAFGGPSEYSGRDLHAAHGRLAALGLDDQHFDAVLEHLSSTLRDAGVTNDVIDEVTLVAESVRDDVLNR